MRTNNCSLRAKACLCPHAHARTLIHSTKHECETFVWVLFTPLLFTKFDAHISINFECKLQSEYDILFGCTRILKYHYVRIEYKYLLENSWCNQSYNQNFVQIIWQHVLWPLDNGSQYLIAAMVFSPYCLFAKAKKGKINAIKNFIS